MKSNPLAAFLVVVAVACSIITAVLAFLIHIWTTELQLLQNQYAYMTNMRGVVQSLAAEATEYSKTHPNIDPVLLQFGIKGKATNAPALNTPAPAQTR